MEAQTLNKNLCDNNVCIQYMWKLILIVQTKTRTKWQLKYIEYNIDIYVGTNTIESNRITSVQYGENKQTNKIIKCYQE